MPRSSGCPGLALDVDNRKGDGAETITWENTGVDHRDYVYLIYVEDYSRWFLSINKTLTTEERGNFIMEYGGKTSLQESQARIDLYRRDETIQLYVPMVNNINGRPM